MGALERWVKSCCLMGELWNARAAGEEAFGSCLRADVMAKGLRSTKDAMLMMLDWVEEML